VAFESKKLSETERRWPTHEKEMWAVIHRLKTWGHYIGSKDVVVWTDNDALPSPKVNPLEGSLKCSCGNLGLGRRSRLPTLERGRGSSWEPRDWTRKRD